MFQFLIGKVQRDQLEEDPEDGSGIEFQFLIGKVQQNEEKCMEQNQKVSIPHR